MPELPHHRRRFISYRSVLALRWRTACASKLMMAAGVSLLAASLLFLFRQVPTAHAATGDAPAYAGNGDMLPVANYREWIYLSSGMDMSYSPQPADMTMFDNVFVNPEAYRSFVATGTWPDKTVLVLENREAKSQRIHQPAWPFPRRVGDGD